VKPRLPGWTWPAAGFLAVGGLHFLWVGRFPELDPAQAGWVSLPVETSWLQIYLDTGAYWLGYAYALSAAFGIHATRSFLRERTGATRNAALGGLTLSGGLALAGCFLVGCCGSPMLAVWLGLFGAAFLPFAKPLVAAATTAMVLAGWLWMRRQQRRQRSGPAVIDWQHGLPAGTPDHAPPAAPHGAPSPNPQEIR
jgi:hypothetical protein